MSAKEILLAALGVTAVAFAAVWLRALVPLRKRQRPGCFRVAVGALTNFFDTLGIGSFATTTAIWRPRQTVDDRLIPGTLNVGHTIPTFAQAFIYMSIVTVEMTTLILLMAASVVGSWLGARVVADLPRKKIQAGMGVALLGAASLILARLLAILPPGGDALGLSGGVLVAGSIANFVFGALMTIGIGAYAPIIVTVSMLGMNPKTAFPIMMGSCAFLMPVASATFIRRSAYDPPAALGLTLGGLPAVFLAAFIVTSLPLDGVRWLVVGVVVYTAVTLLRAARRGA